MQLYESLHDLSEVNGMRRLPAVASLSGRDGLEQVLPAVLASLMVLSTDAQVAYWHLQSHLAPRLRLILLWQTS